MSVFEQMSIFGDPMEVKPCDCCYQRWLSFLCRFNTLRWRYDAIGVDRMVI